MIGKYKIDFLKWGKDRDRNIVIIEPPGEGKYIQIHEDGSYDIIDVIKKDEPQTKQR